MPSNSAIVAFALLCIAPSRGVAQSAAHSSSEPTLSTGYRFSQRTGAELFAHVCQGCHMPDGRGATGAGSYPALVNDKNLEAGGYAVDLVLNGRRAMPPFAAMLNDDQVAAVVNYVRTNFGNDFRDAVTAADVRAVRP